MRRLANQAWWTVAQAAVATVLPGLAAHAGDSCSLTTSGVAFGVYSPLSATPATMTGTLAVNCSWTPVAPTQINLAVYFSTGNSGNYTTRTMTNGTSNLNYNLYFNSNGTAVWGNGTGGSYYGVATLTTATQTGSASANGTIYGVIAAGQDVTPGSYLDTIIVTVSF